MNLFPKHRSSSQERRPSCFSKCFLHDRFFRLHNWYYRSGQQTTACDLQGKEWKWDFWKEKFLTSCCPAAFHSVSALSGTVNDSRTQWIRIARDKRDRFLEAAAKKKEREREKWDFWQSLFSLSDLIYPDSLMLVTLPQTEKKEMRISSDIWDGIFPT